PVRRAARGPAGRRRETRSSAVRRFSQRRPADPGRALRGWPCSGATSRLFMLSLNNVEVIYDGVILVLKGVSITCPEGRITTLLGANGAGKTTTLKAISGLLRSERGQVRRGPWSLPGSVSTICPRTGSCSE